MKTTFKAYIVRENPDGTFISNIETKDLDNLPEGELTVRVKYSSLNYKDALSATGNKGVTRFYPHTPGIDAVGIVEQCNNSDFKIGDKVIVTGYDLGMNTSGGFGQLIRVPSKWAFLLPKGLSLEESMTLGTAGITVGLCVNALEKNNGIKGRKAVVTGATGGVGCLAVKLLAKLGANITAVTGKSNAQEILKSIGANEVISREELSQNFKQPLAKGKWDIGIDVVGGDMLAGLMTCLKQGGSIACCGLVGGPKIITSIFPYILRGNSLLGIDSAERSKAIKQKIMNLFANEWKLELKSISSSVGLDKLDNEVAKILKGGQIGRVVVSLD